MLLRIHIVFAFTLLWCALPAQAQLAFEPAEWDFGSIEESAGRVSHVFEGVNRSDRPVVILDVATSCGCTVPEFSRQPVLPGGTARIKVTFDPMNRPGAFVKELGVYSSDKKRMAALTIRGSVVPREKTVDELYPVDAGGGLRFDGTLCAFTYIYQGQHKQMSIGYTNTSDRPLRLELRPRISSGLLAVDSPHAVAPGERGEMTFAYTLPAAASHYGTLRDALEVWIDGRKSDIALVAHAIGIDNPAKAEKSVAPQAQFSPTIVKFGHVKHSAPVQRQTFVLSNSGGSELIVRAVENDGHIAVVLEPGCTVAPGGSCTVELLLDPSVQDYGILTDHLLVVTNDPARPMRRLRMNAIIEE
ncbi:MAG: DUF1573 domain-containing protein [Alistipes sp.]|nr:DUF1573 domain-containing protein [Alistipes sp.]